MKNKLIKLLNGKSTYKPVNIQAIVGAMERNEEITFYSWECPPRQIVQSKKFGQFVNFDVDIKKVVNGQLLDKFTEVPRITSQGKKELWFIKNILSKYKRAKYIKIIADTNAKYLYIKSYKILGETKMNFLSNKFKKLLEIKSKRIFTKYDLKFYLYTEFQRRFVYEYEMFYKLVYESFKNTRSKFVNKEIYKAWYECMFNHVGYTKKDKLERLDVLKRGIATYAAEGMLFELLNKSKMIPNPVWINWEDKPDMAEASNILRLRYGLNKLPIIYFIPKEI